MEGHSGRVGLADRNCATYHATRAEGLALEALLAEVVAGLGGAVEAFDLYTTLENGFSFARFTSASGSEAVLADRPILQVGRFVGDFPFVAELSGLYRDEPFARRHVVSADAVRTSDTTLVAPWTGRQIAALEAGSQTYDVINEIIRYGLDARVLSGYTAFLALEPEQGGEVCASCRDETQVTPVEDEPVAGEDLLRAYPNPFRDAVTVEVALARPVDDAEVTATIYNVRGQTVRTLRPEGSGPVQRFTLRWDGADAAGTPGASGTYVFALTTPEARHTLSLVKVK